MKDVDTRDKPAHDGERLELMTTLTGFLENPDKKVIAERTALR